MYSLQDCKEICLNHAYGKGCNGQKFHFITTKMISWSKCVNDEQNILQECDNYYYEASLVFH